MSLVETLCVISVVGFAVGLPLAAWRSGRAPWWLPAVLCVLFAVWSTYVVLDGGLFGFWDIHIASPWGGQVFIDLALSTSIAWFVLQPRMRAAGINSWPWLALVATTFSIGLLAMVARLLMAERAVETAGSPGR